MAQQLKVSIGGHSIAGIKEENQDAFAAHIPDGPQQQMKGIACALADGVSSSSDSQIASQTAVTHFLNDYYSTPDSWTVKTAAAKVLTGLNGWLYQHGNRGNRAKDSLVTTFASLIVKSTTAHLFHVGDSRIYRYRDNSLEQLTRDHSSTYDNRSVLTRALGIDPHLDVDYRKETVEQGDIFLFSTDGLHEFLSSKHLKHRLSAIDSSAADSSTTDKSNDKNLEAEAKQLVNDALEAGSDDNISCVLARIDQLPAEELEEAHRKLSELPVPPVMKVGNSIDGYQVLEVIFSGTRSHLYLVKGRRNQSTLCTENAFTELRR